MGVRAAVSEWFPVNAAEPQKDSAIEKGDMPGGVAFDAVVAVYGPLDIIGISIVRRAEKMYVGGRAVAIAVAFKSDVVIQRMTMRFCYREDGLARPSSWKVLRSALQELAEIEMPSLGKTRVDREGLLQEFVNTVVSESAELSRNPLVPVDSTGASELWPWLRD